jgi:serine/threonine protein kinase
LAFSSDIKPENILLDEEGFVHITGKREIRKKSNLMMLLKPLQADTYFTDFLFRFFLQISILPL